MAYLHFYLPYITCIVWADYKFHDVWRLLSKIGNFTPLSGYFKPRYPKIHWCISTLSLTIYF